MVNKVILVGNLGADPEVKDVNGSKVANFRIATSETYTDKQGAKQTNTEWHSIVAWRNLAEIIEKYVKKGSQVYVEGKLQTRSWEKDGVKHYSTEILISTLKMLGGKKEDNNHHSDDGGVPMPHADNLEPNPEDLPF